MMAMLVIANLNIMIKEISWRLKIKNSWETLSFQKDMFVHTEAKCDALHKRFSDKVFPLKTIFITSKSYFFSIL